MLRRLAKLVRNPVQYAPRAAMSAQKSLWQKGAGIFRNTPFFLQGQMDIDPRSHWHNPDFVTATGGFFPKNDHIRRELADLEPWDRTRRDMLTLLLRTIVESHVDGDFVELGVYKGSTAKLIHYYAPDRTLHLFDTFEGFTDRSVVSEKRHTSASFSASRFADTSLEEVRRYIAPKNQNVFFYKGYFPETLPPDFGLKKIAFLHLDADLYEPIMQGLRFFYPRVSKGGMIVVHDYNAWPGARKAVDEFFSETVEMPIPMPDKSGSALIVKQ